MLGRYIQLACDLPYQPLFDATDRLGRCERACLGPAMHFTHRPLTWINQTAANLNFDNVIKSFTSKKIVLIVRYPLDALVSFWFQQKTRVQNGFLGELKEFLDNPVFGLEKLLRFHHLWQESANLVQDFHLLRYEDMKLNPADRFRELLNFLDIVPEEKLLEAAVDYSSFENMKKLEISGSEPQYPSSGLSIFATGDRKDPDAFHVRRGKVGGYKDYLDSITATHYEGRVSCEMGVMYGYDKI